MVDKLLKCLKAVFFGYFQAYETHSAVRRPNAVLCKRMRGATDKSKSYDGCMEKNKREKKAALSLQ